MPTLSKLILNVAARMLLRGKATHFSTLRIKGRSYKLTVEPLESLLETEWGRQMLSVLNGEDETKGC